MFHRATYSDDNPVLQPDQQWEEAQQPTACAMPFSDGVAYDPADGLYKLWYMAGFGSRHTCLATSADGRTWRKPDWRVVPGTNIVWPSHSVHGRDSQTVVRDPLRCGLAIQDEQLEQRPPGPRRSLAARIS